MLLQDGRSPRERSDNSHRGTLVTGQDCERRRGYVAKCQARYSTQDMSQIRLWLVSKITPHGPAQPSDSYLYSKRLHFQNTTMKDLYLL